MTQAWLALAGWGIAAFTLGVNVGAWAAFRSVRKEQRAAIAVLEQGAPK